MKDMDAFRRSVAYAKMMFTPLMLDEYRENFKGDLPENPSSIEQAALELLGLSKP